jgi:hypothetical protein
VEAKIAKPRDGLESELTMALLYNLSRQQYEIQANFIESGLESDRFGLIRSGRPCYRVSF